jgi:hypothetical protein
MILNVPYVDGQQTNNSKPLIHATICFDSGACLKPKFLAETGASMIIVDARLVAAEKLQLSDHPPNAIISPFASWQGKRYKLRFTSVDFSIRGNNGVVSWKATIAIWSAETPFSIFGQFDGLEKFNARFKPVERCLELETISPFNGRILSKS